MYTMGGSGTDGRFEYRHLFQQEAAAGGAAMTEPAPLAVMEGIPGGGGGSKFGVPG